MLRNRPGPLVALVATLGTGREVVTLSPHLGDIGLEQDIVELAPDVVVAEDEDWARDAVLVSARTVGAIALRTGADRALAAQPVLWSPRPSLQDTRGIAVLMMTSGTTGRPKRVELTYERMTAAFRATGLVFDEVHKPRLHSRTDILWASLAHISGLYFAVAHAVEGRSIALLERFDVAAWAELVGRHRPGYVRLAPTALRMVLQAEVPVETFASVRAVGSGTAPLPPELAEAFEARYGIPVLGTYGATEFAGAIAGWTLKDKKLGAAQARQRRARPPRHRAARRRRGKRRRAPAGQTGLLEARGGQLPGAEGAWLRTTDLATIDDDMFLFIRGRADEAIKPGGFKIPPSGIEDALAAHPAVDEASAVGLPDTGSAKCPAAAVTLLSPATEGELMEYLDRAADQVPAAGRDQGRRPAAADALAQDQPRAGARALLQRLQPRRRAGGGQRGRRRDNGRVMSTDRAGYGVLTDEAFERSRQRIGIPRAIAHAAQPRGHAGTGPGTSPTATATTTRCGATRSTARTPAGAS